MSIGVHLGIGWPHVMSIGVHLGIGWPHVMSIGVHLGIGKPNILDRTSVYFLEEEQTFCSHLSNVHLFEKANLLIQKQHPY